VTTAAPVPYHPALEVRNPQDRRGKRLCIKLICPIDTEKTADMIIITK